MSLISTFVDAFKRAAGKKPEVDMKTYGPLGSTTQPDGKSFDPLRPTPESDTGGKRVDRGDVSQEPEIASGDPEEGGEATRP
jgi:hypothetical protein